MDFRELELNLPWHRSLIARKIQAALEAEKDGLGIVVRKPPRLTVELRARQKRAPRGTAAANAWEWNMAPRPDGTGEPSTEVYVQHQP